MEETSPLPKGAKRVFEGKVFSVWQWEQELYDGSFRTFELVSRADAAMVIGVLPNKNILILEDHQPHRKPLLSLPGGRIDADETPENAAKREFLEETGYEIGNLEFYCKSKIGTSAHWYTHFFIGKNLKQLSRPQNTPGEKLVLFEYAFEDFLKLGQNPKFRNIELRLQLLEAQLDKSKQDTLYKVLYG